MLKNISNIATRSFPHIFPCKIWYCFHEAKKVYKLPLIENNLVNFLLLQPIRTYDQVALPIGVVYNFFTFPLLHPPLNINRIRECFKSYATSSLHALEALHAIGFVHMDVRTPNICFKQSDATDHEWQAVLIVDLFIIRTL